LGRAEGKTSGVAVLRRRRGKNRKGQGKGDGRKPHAQERGKTVKTITDTCNKSKKKKSK